MTKFKTKHFGEIEYDEEKVLSFPDAIPGFPDATRFLLMNKDESEDMFFWLQCLDDGDVAFTLMDVYQVLGDYDPMVDSEEIQALGDISGAPLNIYNIVVIPEDVKQMRVNLKAPIVINTDTGVGKQVICSNEDYKIRFYIFEEFEKARAAAAQE